MNKIKLLKIHSQRPYRPLHRPQGADVCAGMLWWLHICHTWLQMLGLMLAAPGGRCNWHVWGQTAWTAPPYKPTLPTGLQIPTRTQTSRHQPRDQQADHTAADLRVSAPSSCVWLSVCPDASFQLCPTCPAPPAAAGRDLQCRVARQRREGKSCGCSLTETWCLCED